MKDTTTEEHKRPAPGSVWCVCGSKLKYNKEYDAYYCRKSRIWVEKACEDPDCVFCPGRPRTAEML